MAIEVQDCTWCGRRHAMVCPRLREIEWDYGGGVQRIKRVVFWDMGNVANDFSQVLKTYWEVDADGRSKGETGAGGGVAPGDDQHPRNGG